MQIIVVLFALVGSLLLADFDYQVENSNFTIGTKERVYNYDRLRFRGDYTQGDFFATIIGDGVNYYGEEYVNSLEFSFVKYIDADVPFKTQTSFYEYDKGLAYAKLYRLYGGYEDIDNRIVVGLQNISMGVGRIWTPTNLFNPKNIYALEPDETFGVAALLYTRHINDTSNLTAIVSQKEDNSYKYAARYKAFLEFGDVAIDAISSDETKMLGLELEANLGESGIEIRSEVAYIQNELTTSLSTKEETRFAQAIIGADYGFVNGITLIGEALYSSKSFTSKDLLLNLDSEILPNLVYSQFYTALSLSYSFNIFLDGSLTYIESFNDKNSRYISPSLSYTLNDYNTFVVGAQIFDGSSLSEFTSSQNSYYLRYLLSF